MFTKEEQKKKVGRTGEIRRVLGGVDLGSGFSALFTHTEDTQSFAIIPSWVSTGTLEEIAQRLPTQVDDPARLLAEDEFVVEYLKTSRYAGRLGRNAGAGRTDAVNDPRRYSNEHALSLLLSLCGRLIPEDEFELYFVIGLPLSLQHDKTRCYEVQDYLTREIDFCWNGRMKHARLLCGSVVPEGAGGLMIYGDTESETLTIDIGFRTCNVLSSTGQIVDITRSGCIPIGVGSLFKAFNDAFYNLARRRLDHDETDRVLRAYVHGQPLPEVGSNRRIVDSVEITTILKTVYANLGDQLNTAIAQIVSQDGHGTVAADYKKVNLIGGGAYHYRLAIEQMIAGVRIVTDPQAANPEGYLEIAKVFPAQVWASAQRAVDARKQAKAAAQYA